MDRAIGDGIGILLETFQELTRKGNQATLFLETRNGKQFGTLKVKSYPVKPEEPSKWRKNKRKSLSVNLILKTIRHRSSLILLLALLNRIRRYYKKIFPSKVKCAFKANYTDNIRQWWNPTILTKFRVDKTRNFQTRLLLHSSSGTIIKRIKL